MASSGLVVVATTARGTGKAIEAALHAGGFPFRIESIASGQTAGILSAGAAAVIADTGIISALSAEDREILRKAGIQILLAYDLGQTGKLPEGLSQDISDFVELPVDQPHFNAQISRTLDIARLRQQLTSLEQRVAQDSQTFDALLSERTKQRNEAENRSLALSRRLADLDKLKSNLITVISHEFKTPLHLASGYANLLADGSSGQLNEEQRSAVEVITRQLSRLSAKLSDIERIAQLEMGLSHDTTEPVDIAVVLEHEIAGFQQAFSKFRLQVIVDISRALPIIRGSQDFLADVFRRLIDNAIHYNKDGGRIEIRAKTAETNGKPGIQVEVIDNGKGIPPALLPHIFERFGEFRDIEHHSSRQSGLGLGLAICRHLVEMHHGDITVESELGKGSAFRVWLPAG
ncbi:MAG: hypothetical protein HUU29_05280 [Planctomycetaceae bacterium]|nr:hypothetical protein [Planctomycetaceae bacterium]